MDIGEVRPRDIFQSALDIIFRSFEVLGYKQLKNGTIKKKLGALSFEIRFGSSHHNYIATAAGRGSVILEVVCFVMQKDMQLYTFRFSESRARTHRFELLDKDCGLDYSVLDYIIEGIWLNFIEFTSMLETDPVKAVETFGLVPEIVSDDYRFTRQMKRELPEFFGLDEQIKIYDINAAEYMSVQNRASRNLDSYCYCMVTGKRIDTQICKNLDKADLLGLAREVDAFMSSASKYSELAKETYRQIMEYEQNNMVRMTMSVYTMCNFMTSYFRSEPSAQDLIGKIDALHDRVFYR